MKSSFVSSHRVKDEKRSNMTDEVIVLSDDDVSIVQQLLFNDVKIFICQRVLSHLLEKITYEAICFGQVPLSKLLFMTSVQGHTKLTL